MVLSKTEIALHELSMVCVAKYFYLCLPLYIESDVLFDFKLRLLALLVGLGIFVLAVCPISVELECFFRHLLAFGFIFHVPSVEFVCFKSGAIKILNFNKL